MFDTTPATLKRLAALVWFSGVIALAIKSGSLLLEAEEISPNQPWTWLSIAAGLSLGAIKAKYIFGKLCIKNLRRIDALKHPKIWHCYRLQFFVFLFLMVSLGGYLSRIAHGDYPMLIAVATVDITIATALLGSGWWFWREPK